KKVLVLGAGKSGVTAAKFLATKGAVVALHDKKPIAEWDETARALKETSSVGLLDGDIPSWLLDQIELVVISPGIPSTVVPARYVERKDGAVIGEVELAYRFMRGRIIGITGSNGKTTTTSLLGEILQNAGIEAFVGGNIGTPLLSLAEATNENSWTIVELSSFQLETISMFKPDIGICLNVTPNHMDRYDLFTDYAAAKNRLFMNQTTADLAILNADDPITADWAKGLMAQVALFSISKELDEGLFLRGRELISRAGGKEKVLTTRDEMALRGVHNVQNVLAALAAGLACGAAPDSMRETIRKFKAVEHRLEFIANIDGVDFFNDSKATSVDATLKALEAFEDEPGEVVLILGGLGKNAPYAPLVELIEKKVRLMVLVGEDAKNIESQLGDAADSVFAESLEEAAKAAMDNAEAGDTILLAPACASYDMFRSYEERGEVFKKAVNGLKSQ
ncbi:MAG: UDP-N-acetylmuramoyl-L-alanine--D-glutamate ligase, partial [Pyrinomonadaceae bacterium]